MIYFGFIDWFIFFQVYCPWQHVARNVGAGRIFYFEWTTYWRLAELGICGILKFISIMKNDIFYISLVNLTGGRLFKQDWILGNRFKKRYFIKNKKPQVPSSVRRDWSKIFTFYLFSLFLSRMISTAEHKLRCVSLRDHISSNLKAPSLSLVNYTVNCFAT